MLGRCVLNRFDSHKDSKIIASGIFGNYRIRFVFLNLWPSEYLRLLFATPVQALDCRFVSATKQASSNGPACDSECAVVENCAQLLSVR